MYTLLCGLCLILACGADVTTGKVKYGDQSRIFKKSSSQCPSNGDLMEEIEKLKHAINKVPTAYAPAYPVVLVSANDDLAYAYNFEQGKQACKDKGMELASYDQVHAAWTQGLDACSCGWIRDGRSVFPIIYPRSGCFENEAPGIRGCIWDPNLWNVWCFDKDAANKLGRW